MSHFVKRWRENRRRGEKGRKRGYLTLSEEGGCLMATMPWTLALLGSGFSSWTCICSGFTSRTTGLLLFCSHTHNKGQSTMHFSFQFISFS